MPVTARRLRRGGTRISVTARSLRRGGTRISVTARRLRRGGTRISVTARSLRRGSPAEAACSGVGVGSTAVTGWPRCARHDGYPVTARRLRRGGTRISVTARSLRRGSPAEAACSDVGIGSTAVTGWPRCARHDGYPVTARSLRRGSPAEALAMAQSLCGFLGGGSMFHPHLRKWPHDRSEYR